MKKSNITIDPINKTITISKAFYKKATVYGSNEYNELRAATSENPSFNIEFKTSEKKTYHGLSFSRMKEYIKTQPDSETRLIEFETVKEIAKAKGSQYPLTKKWFLLTYTEYKESSVSEDETAAKVAEARAEAERKILHIEKVS